MLGVGGVLPPAGRQVSNSIVPLMSGGTGGGGAAGGSGGAGGGGSLAIGRAPSGLGELLLEFSDAFDGLQLSGTAAVGGVRPGGGGGPALPIPSLPRPMPPAAPGAASAAASDTAAAAALEVRCKDGAQHVW